MQRFGDDLVLLERLAAGGMAEVFRAKRIGYGGFEKTVALKRILPHYASSDDFKTMFRMEANLSAHLQNPNIAQVFGNGEFEGYLYLVMEFLDGRNVRQLLGRADREKFRIPIEISCFIAAETAKGLGYAYRFADERTGKPMKIVHRDMSPQNIMLTYDGSVKIVDFGIAKAAARSDMTRAGVLKGKFGYMSPEQAKGEKLDNRSDIFSLGIILWEMLTQRRLFSAEDDMRTLQLVRECKIPKPSSKNPLIPYALDRIVLKALSKDKADRYETAEEFYADVSRFMNERYPEFLSTDLSKFLRKVYAEDITEDKKKREKQNLEAPAILSVPKANKVGRGDKPFSPQQTDEDLTPIDDDFEENTELSDAGAEAPKKLSVQESVNLIEDDEEKDPQKEAVPIPAPQEKEFIKKDTPKSRYAESPQASRVRVVRRRVETQPKIWERLSAKHYTVIAASFLIVFLLIPTSNNKSTNLAETSPKEQTAVAQENTSSLPDDLNPAQNSAEAPVAVRMPSSLKPAIDNAEHGRLEIVSIPKADEVWVDGKILLDAKNQPVKTPFKDYPIKAGKYTVTLKNKAFKVQKVIELEVQEKRIHKKNLYLDDKLKPAE